LSSLESKSKNFGGFFDITQKQKRIKDLEEKSQSPKIWGNPKELEKLNREKSALESSVDEFITLFTKAEDAEVLLEMAIEGESEEDFDQVKTELLGLNKLWESLETKRLLSKETDSNSCYMSINSGAGGTEACDWADMLFRMFTRYSEAQGYKVDVLETTPGEEAGLKSITFEVSGAYAYGFLKNEIGVHRLVRISPFDSNAKRHTSFASVFVWPQIDDNIEVDIKTEDLKVDTYRASGAGGQHVNTTDSAVRITHIPTGTVVQCQKERSQHANRDRAMKMLNAALYELEVQKREAEKNEQASGKKINEWGSQIRSYVLHPYKMVKDHRTKHESSAAEKVLDGDLQLFIEAELKRVALEAKGEE